MGIERAVERFGLGRLEAEPVRVPGGLSNELWRVRTGAGEFAVKRMVINADQPQFVDNVEAAFGVERRAWDSGVPIPEPVAVNGRALLRVDGDLYRAHRWVDGNAGQATVRQAAELLAGIHAAGRGRLKDMPGTGWSGARWGDGINQLARRVVEHPSRTSNRGFSEAGWRPRVAGSTTTPTMAGPARPTLPAPTWPSSPPA